MTPSLPPSSGPGRPPWSRRRFLTALVAGAAGAAVTACSSDSDGSARQASTAGGEGRPGTTLGDDPAAAALDVPELSGPPFTLGVASGDPLADSVILWTRLAPEPLEGGGMPDVDVPVGWEVATDEQFSDIVRSGTAVARPTLGHSVHVDPGGLEADTWYWYRFTVGDSQSPVGRTRTAPARDAQPDELRFAFASCQRYDSGYYSAHRSMATEDLDLVVFLGDYIYEGGINLDRPRLHNSDEVVTLEEYRNRYGLYKSDEHLRNCHAAFPWAVIWDDHEVDNNYADLVPEDGSDVGPGGFEERRAAAYQAWYEHLPVRVDPPDGPDLQIYRSLRWGALVDLFLIDARQYRSNQGCGDATLDFSPACDDILVPGRTMLGTEQKQWLLDGLSASDSTWRILANSVVFANVMFDAAVLNYDQWDGYPEARQQILDHLIAEDIDNVVSIAGDIHFSACGDVRHEGHGAGSPIVAAEFAGTSISTAPPPGMEDAIGQFAVLFEDVHYANGAKRGYVRCTVRPEQWRTDYIVMDSVEVDDAPASVDASFEIDAGTPGMRPV
jgi:alkaline phosphatase D